MRQDSPLRRAARAAAGHPAAAALCGILALYLLTRLIALTRVPVFFDESIYIRWSQELLSHGRFLVSLTDGKPPLHVWWMAPLVRVVGDPLLAGRLASVLAGGLTTCGMFLLGRELSGWRLGAWASLLYVACPFTLWYDRLAIAEGLLLTTFVFAAWLALRAARKLDLRLAVPLGLVIGMSLLTKGTAGLLYLVLPFAVLAARPWAGAGGKVRAGCARDGGCADGAPGAPVRVEGETAGDGAGEAACAADAEGDAVSGRGAALARWAGILAVAYATGYGLYSLLRLSSRFGLIGARTAATTRGVAEILADPFELFFANLGTIAGTLVVFLTPVLFALAVAGLAWGAGRGWRPAGFLLAWVLAVVVVESLVAKHWMFDTILPRFFLSAVPPLLLAAGYLCGLVGDAVRGWRPSWKAARPLLALALVVVLLALPLFTDAMALVSPCDADLPYWVRVQYLTDWPSGWGVRESARFLEEMSADGPVAVGSNLNGIGLPTDGLEMYLDGNRDVEIIPFNYAETAFPAGIARAAGSRRTYLVYNSFPGMPAPPADWPLELVERFPKDGNEEQALYLFRVIGPGR